MIAPTVVKRIVSRFERAVAHRACVRAGGQKETASTLFEYRQSKRELLALITLLRTGENPDNSMEDKLWTQLYLANPKQDGTVSSGGPPKEPSPR